MQLESFSELSETKSIDKQLDLPLVMAFKLVLLVESSTSLIKSGTK